MGLLSIYEDHMKLLLLLLLTACASTPPSTIKEADQLAVETLKLIEVTALSEKKVAVIVSSLTGFDEKSAARFKKIAANVEVILNSPEYKEAILNHTWKGKKQFVSTTDSNETVYKKITSADWKLEYRLERLSRFSKVIGYTYPNVSWIVINSRKFPFLSDADIACNIAHEYGGHKLGRYNHDMNWSEARDYSTPYGIGYTLEKIYVEKFGQ